MAWFKVPSMGMKMRIQYCFTWHTIIHHVPSYVMMFCSLNKTVQLQNCFGELLCLGNLLLLLNMQIILPCTSWYNKMYPPFYKKEEKKGNGNISSPILQVK